MNAPPKFVVDHPLKHRSPDHVRNLARSLGFQLRTAQGTHESEIWSRPDGASGYWIIRLDTMGHGTGKVVAARQLKQGEKPKPNYFFSERPHYHKNWVESLHSLRRYCQGYLPQAFVYADSGELLGQAGDHLSMHPDKKAKLQHILR